MNVGMTRCGDCLVVVGEVRAARSIKRANLGHYLDVIDEFMESKAVLTGDATSLRSKPVILQPEEEDMGQDLFGLQATISSSNQDRTACAKTPCSLQADANMELSGSDLPWQYNRILAS